MNSNLFINKTTEVLLPGYNKNRLCSTEFKSVRSKDSQKCILVFGINPAGDESNAIGEKDSCYLYYLPGVNIPGRTYSTFYKPIFELVSKAAINNVKWAWCNYHFNEIDDIINKDTKLKEYSDEIRKHYSDYKDKKYSLYIGEFFYYHMTSQTDFLKLIDSSKISNYYIEMLNLHIDEIVNHGNTVELILVNNATASHELCKSLGVNEGCSYYDYNYKDHQYRILFAAMLSGRRAMDTFSKARLINEIKLSLE